MSEMDRDRQINAADMLDRETNLAMQISQLADDDENMAIASSMSRLAYDAGQLIQNDGYFVN